MEVKMSKLKEMSMCSITSIATSEDGANTYRFTKEFEDLEGKRAILILLYPTRTEENYHVEDSTTIHIMKHMKKLGLKSYTIINLFSHVVKKRLSTRGLKVDRTNLQYIQKEIFEKYNPEEEMVIIAWGNSHESSQAVNSAKKILLEMWMKLHPTEKLYHFTVVGKEIDGDGIHPLYLGIRYGNGEWKLSQYPIKKVLKELKVKTVEKSEMGKDSK